MLSSSRQPALAIALAMSAFACAPSKGEPEARIALDPCTVQGVRSPAKCGKVSVFEDRAAKSGRTIDLQVVVIPALASAPKADPIFFLAGGPGQAATTIGGFALGVADRLHESRDIVLVDQRGTGHSNGLFCEVLPDDAPLAERLDSKLDPDLTEHCREDQDADLRLYGTSIAVDDLDDVREALGYSQINLWGTSYGTRVALAYLRAHGPHARSVVLDGVAPMSLYLPLSLAKDADRALFRLFDDCAADATCNAAFPALKERFARFVDRLSIEPLSVDVAHPVTGAIEPLTLDRESFLSALRGMLYSPELSALVPLALDRAMNRDLGAFVTIALTLGAGMESSFATGMFLSVVCTEDVPFLTKDDIQREAEGTLFGAESGLNILRSCELWPRGEVPKDFRDPVKSDVPTLLLSGQLDPVTPPSWADAAQKGLSRSENVVFSGTGHNAATTACARRIVTRFIEKGSPGELDTECASQIPRPRFYMTFAGPR